MPWVLFPIGIAVGAAVEFYRFRARQPLVRAWLEHNGWTVRSLRYEWKVLGWSWLIYYAVEVVDSQGRESSGVVYAGADRRKVGWHRLYTKA